MEAAGPVLPRRGDAVQFTWAGSTHYGLVSVVEEHTWSCWVMDIGCITYRRVPLDKLSPSPHAPILPIHRALMQHANGCPRFGFEYIWSVPGPIGTGQLWRGMDWGDYELQPAAARAADLRCVYDKHKYAPNFGGQRELWQQVCAILRLDEKELFRGKVPTEVLLAEGILSPAEVGAVDNSLAPALKVPKAPAAIQQQLTIQQQQALDAMRAAANLTARSFVSGSRQQQQQQQQQQQKVQQQPWQLQQHSHILEEQHAVAYAFGRPTHDMPVHCSAAGGVPGLAAPPAGYCPATAHQQVMQQQQHEGQLPVAAVYHQLPVEYAGPAYPNSQPTPWAYHQQQPAALPLPAGLSELPPWHQQQQPQQPNQQQPPRQYQQQPLAPPVLPHPWHRAAGALGSTGPALPQHPPEFVEPAAAAAAAVAAAVAAAAAAGYPTYAPQPPGSNMEHVSRGLQPGDIVQMTCPTEDLTVHCEVTMKVLELAGVGGNFMGHETRGTPGVVFLVQTQACRMIGGQSSQQAAAATAAGCTAAPPAAGGGCGSSSESNGFCAALLPGHLLVLKVPRALLELPPRQHLELDTMRHDEYVSDLMAQHRIMRKAASCPNTLDSYAFGQVAVVQPADTCLFLPGVLMEYADQGCLADRIWTNGSTNPGVGLDPATAWACMRHVGAALEYLNNRGICFRFKPQNILLVAGPAGGVTAKLCGFGSANDRLQPGDVAEQAAPGCYHGSLAVCYSFGMLLVVMRTGKRNPFGHSPALSSFNNCRTLDCARRIAALRLDEVCKLYRHVLSSRELDFVLECMRGDVSQRPSISMLLGRPYMTHGP